MLKDNLKSLREAKGLTKKQVAAGVGITDRAYIAYEYGERDVSTETLSKLADFYGVTTDFLLGREPDTSADAVITAAAKQYGLTSQQKGLLAAYLYMDTEDRESLLDLVRRLAEGSMEGTQDRVVRPIRLHLSRASAGCGYDLGDSDSWEQVKIFDSPAAWRADFAVEVEGESMEPDFHDGDLALVETGSDVPVGKVGLFVVDGKGYIKERGKERLISRNPDFPDVTGEARCVGLVVGTAERAEGA